MGKNINQIYVTNPLASISGTDLLYVGQASVDGAIQFQNVNVPRAQVTGLHIADSPDFAGLTLTGFSGVVKASAGVLSAAAIVNADLAAGSFTNITGTGILTAGTWNATVITGQYGGTGVANTGSTITLGGSLTTSGAFASTFTMTGVTNVTFPTSGTLLTASTCVNSAQGTANQILVNGTSGSPTVGAITLTLPQNIAPGSSPTFAGLTLTAFSGVVQASAGVLSASAAAALTKTDDTNVTLTLGGSPTTALVNAASLTLGWTGTLSGARGGTGVANTGSTITLGGNFATSGAFAATLTLTNTTTVTLPTSGTLVNTAVTTLSSLASIGTITTGVWNGTIVTGPYGGTGINNGGYTITLGGNVSTAGAFITSGVFQTTLTVTGTTSVTLPTSGTLVNTAVTTLSSLASIGTITTGVWNGTIITGQYGGTGVANTGSTITLGGNLTTSGAFATTLTATGTTSVTLPTSGTLVNTAVTTLSSLVSIGTVTTGTWNATVVTGQYGGTGVANTSKTITLGGNLTTSGAFNTTLTVTADTNVTLPTSGTLVNSAVATLSSLVSIGTITTGVWHGTVVTATYGGTGVNNGAYTITVGGNISTAGAFTTSGVYATTLTMTGTTTVTLPTSGTLVASATNVTFAQLTTTDLFALGSGSAVRSDAAGLIRGTIQGTGGAGCFGIILDTHMGASSGTVSTACELYVYNNSDSNSGTITNSYSIYISGGTSSGTVTTTYGLFVEQPGFGTTKVCAQFQGKVTIGQTLGSSSVNLNLTTYSSVAGSGVASGGSAQTLPATPQGWWVFNLNGGANVAVPYYNSLLI